MHFLSRNVSVNESYINLQIALKLCYLFLQKAMGKKHASRKYTDLILEASARWPNLEPSIKMEVILIPPGLA